MATLARSVIANEYSVADEAGTMYPGDEAILMPQRPDEISVGSGGVASSSEGSVGVAGDGLREESPASSSSSAEHLVSS